MILLRRTESDNFANILCKGAPFEFPAICRKKLTAAFDGGRLSSDGEVLLLAQAVRCKEIAAALTPRIADRGDQSLYIHDLADILRAHMLAIACGYEVAIDLDVMLRYPGFKLEHGE